MTVQLHLNTIHAVVQLRPSLENLKSGGSKKKNNVAVDAEATVKVEESAKEKSVGPSKKQVIFFYLTYATGLQPSIAENISAWI